MKHPLTALALALALTLGATSSIAVAGKARTSQISNIGIQSFDRIFKEARQIDNTIISAQQTRKEGRQNLNSVLGLDPQTSFQDSLEELQSRGQGKLKVASRGNTPSLQASDAVPSNVQSAVDAVNNAVSNYQTLLTDLASLPEDSQALVQQSRNLSVSELRSQSQIRSISDISTRFQQVRQLRDNVEAIRKLPNKSQRLISNLQGDVGAVSSVFPSR